jgi:cytochrome P450
MSGSSLDMEAEEHRVWRQLMSRAFTSRSVERLRPFLAEEAHRLIDAFLPLGECDFVQAFARRLPSWALCELIGVPSEDRGRFADWAGTIGLGFNYMALPTKIGEVDAALVQLFAYIDELVAARRAEPRDDLVTRIMQAVDEIGGLDEATVRGAVASVVAGNDATKNQLGWMIIALAEVPEEWDRVASEPARARDVIEEVLRLRPAVTGFWRLALQDVELFGERIPAGINVSGSVWSANRDATEFPRPDEFAADENREGVQLTFGHGAHHCVGAALARAELQESLVALSSRMHCPKVGPGAEFLPPLLLNGPSILPISFTPR